MVLNWLLLFVPFQAIQSSPWYSCPKQLSKCQYSDKNQIYFNKCFFLPKVWLSNLNAFNLSHAFSLILVPLYTSNHHQTVDVCWSVHDIYSLVYHFTILSIFDIGFVKYYCSFKFLFKYSYIVYSGEFYPSYMYDCLYIKLT